MMSVSPDSIDDIALMRQIAAQDQRALPTLYQRYGRAIYSLAYHLLQNSVLAEEVMQDVVLKVWLHKTEWDPSKGTLRNWLLSIAHFTAIDRLRRERRQPTLHPASIDEMTDRRKDGPLTHLDGVWQDEIVLRMLLDQLPRDHATLVELAFYRGMSHSEIATATKLPLGTVKTRLRSGLQRLRELWLESMRQTSAET